MRGKIQLKKEEGGWEEGREEDEGSACFCATPQLTREREEKQAGDREDGGDESQLDCLTLALTDLQNDARSTSLHLHCLLQL